MLRYIAFTRRPGSFPLVASGRAAPIVVSGTDHPGVVRVVDDLRRDIERVTAVEPALSVDRVPAADEVVIVGTVGRSPLVDGLVAAGKLDVTGLAGAWETAIGQVVPDPV